MTKKHFIALADALRKSRPGYSSIMTDAETAARKQWDEDVDAVAGVCKAQSARFDTERWMFYIEKLLWR